MITEIILKNFEEKVLKSDKAVLLDFWAEWCGPCRMLSAVIDEISAERDDITIGKINVDEQPELANKFGVSSIPFIAVFKNGKMTTSSVGYQPKENLLSLLD